MYFLFKTHAFSRGYPKAPEGAFEKDAHLFKAASTKTELTMLPHMLFYHRKVTLYKSTFQNLCCLFKAASDKTESPSLGFAV